MSAVLELWVEGVGAWAPGLVDWPIWRDFLRGQADPAPNAPARPKPVRLGAGERRRASLHVLAALEVAEEAVTMSGRDATTLASVFTSMHGDAGIMDYMCAVLADKPTDLSPTRFHNSVHNAAVGYWTIATGCHAPSNAVAALDTSFGAGLLEAASQARAEDRPTLLVAHDEPGSGPLGQVLATTRAFACALLLAPQPGPRALARLRIRLGAPATDNAPTLAAAQALAAANPCGQGVVLLEALAHHASQAITLAATPDLGLQIEVSAAD